MPTYSAPSTQHRERSDDMPDLPTGTVTFLLTDLEGSTRLWEQYPDAMREALARHDALLTASIEGQGGRVIRSRGEGDSFFAVFTRATDSIAAACAVQRALAAEAWPVPAPLRVRVGINTGEAQLREGDYYGTAVNRCARLRAIAHGGQVLLSQATSELVCDLLPPGVSLRDLGTHRLKDLQRPEQVYQLVIPDLPSDFPPLNSLDALPNNLPLQLTQFVGREREIAEIKERLTTTRLLTLTGIGGAGKTRLALQVAAELLDAYPGGVWLVELAALTDPTLVPQAVASALGVREEPGRPLTATLAEHLKPQRLLLILDNCEHLVAACASLAHALLTACPGLRIIATSRELLGIAGETLFRVPPLSWPLPDITRSKNGDLVSSLTRFEAVQLFLDRAIQHQPKFALTPANAPAMAQVCRRLDGIPLAIELAAARVKVLSVEQIAARLDDRFRLLTAGSRTALPRQQTLSALIDWSYDLLSEAERTLLRRLSVFMGGFTLEAAEAICAGEEIDPFEMLDLLAQLVDKSLVLTDEQDGNTRYRLLETIREYGRAKLQVEDPGEEHSALFRRHRDWYLELAEQAEPALVGSGQAEWLNRLEAEHDNLRAALRWSVEAARAASGGCRRPEVEAALRMGGALWRFWSVRGYLAEGRERLAEVMALEPGCEPDRDLLVARAKALNAAGALADLQGDYAAARAFCEQSLAILRELQDQHGMAKALSNLGLVAHNQGDYDSARSLYEESLEIDRELGNEWGMAASLNNLGNLHYAQGRLAEAEACYAQAVQIWERLGDAIERAQILNNLGSIFLARGQLERAEEQLQSAYQLFREAGHPLNTAAALATLGEVYLEAGRLAEAVAALEEALTIAEPVRMPDLVVYIRAVLAHAYLEQGRLEEGARCCAAALPASDSPEPALSPVYEGRARRVCALILQARGEHEAALAELERAREIFVDAHQPQELGRTYVALAMLQRETGKPETAAELLRAAISLFEEAGAEADLEKARAIDASQ